MHTKGSETRIISDQVVIRGSRSTTVQWEETQIHYKELLFLLTFFKQLFLAYFVFYFNRLHYHFDRAFLSLPPPLPSLKPAKLFTVQTQTIYCS